jgi:hypothetical protein
VSQNLRIIWDNRFFIAANLAASSAADNFPVSNLQDKMRSRTWRTTGLTAESLTVDFGESIYCTCLALVDHNFTVAGTVRVQAADDPAFAVLLKDDVYDACEDMIGFGEGGFGAHGAGGTILYEERSFYAPKTLRIIYFEPAAGEDHVRARYWRLIPTDPDNPTGYFSLGRMFLCTHDSYAYQFEFGWDMGGEDESEITPSVGGQDWIDRRPVRRTLRLPWQYFDDVDKYWRLAFFSQTVGVSQDFIIDPVPDGRTSERFFTSMLGRLSEIPKIAAGSPGLSEVELNIIEQL